MPKFLRCSLAVVSCGTLAGILSVLFRGYQVRGSVPALFLLALVFVSYTAGRTAGLLSALVGAAIFAIFLFEPYGNVAVRNAEDKVMLLGFALAALVTVRVSANPQTRP